MKNTTLIALVSSLPCLLLGGSATVLKTEINDLVTAANATDQQDAIDTLVSNAWKAGAVKEGDKILEFRRADVQNGAGSGASGSTSAILSPLLPAVFGFAFETGGITRSISGSTITLKANPAGLVCSSSTQPAVASAVARRDPDVCKTFWKRFGLTASFDTSRGDKSKDLANLSAVSNQFTDFTARYEVLNRRVAGPNADFEKTAKELANDVANFFALNPTFNATVEKAIRDRMGKPDWAALDATAKNKAIADAIDAVVPNTTNLNAIWLASLKAYARALENKAVVTLEYGYQQPDVATEAIGTIVPAGIRPPNLHSARMIYAQGLGSRNLDFTVNISGSWFDEIRPGMSGRFRDLRAGLEGKFKLREIAKYGAPTLSFAGLYVYMHQRPLGIGISAFNGTALNMRGNIGLFQTKLEFPTANNSIRIPVSFTYSNRTELIKESDVRGQIGVSFNLGSLFGN